MTLKKPALKIKKAKNGKNAENGQKCQKRQKTLKNSEIASRKGVDFWRA